MGPKKGETLSNKNSKALLTVCWDVSFLYFDHRIKRIVE